MAVIEHELHIDRRHGFTAVPNEIVRDDALSFRARGVLVWMLSHVDGFTFSADTIAASGTEGRDAVRTALHELEAAGYYRVVKSRRDGRWVSEAFVTDTPRTEVSLSLIQETGNQRSGNQRSGNQRSENQRSIENQEEDQEENQLPVGDEFADRRVFDAWITSTGRTTRTVFSASRKKLIRSRLREYPVEDLIDAVRGWNRSPWHRGENDRGVIYNDLELLLRDARNIEKFRDLHRQPRKRERSWADDPDWRT